MELVGLEGELLVGDNPITLQPGAIQAVNASVLVKAGQLDRPLPFKFRIVDVETGEEKDAASATFVGPVPGQASR
ncbi:hypothetical protein D3C78_1910730 [compost metagenome]